MSRHKQTFSYRVVARRGRRGTAWARDTRAVSRRGASDDQDADAACRTPVATAECPTRHYPAASATALDPDPCPAFGPGPGLVPDPVHGLDLGLGLCLDPAPTGSALCTSNRPSSGFFPYPSDPYVCVYVCRDGEAVWS